MSKEKDKEAFERYKTQSQFAKFSSMAFQMAGTIILGVWGGMKLDDYFALDFPAFTLIFSLLSVSIAMTWMIYKIPKPK